jgi:hypothetical protein
MPAKSAKQYGLMQAATHGMAKGLGAPSESVAKEFIAKTPSDKKHKFARALAAKRKKE